MANKGNIILDSDTTATFEKAKIILEQRGMEITLQNAPGSIEFSFSENEYSLNWNYEGIIRITPTQDQKSNVIIEINPASNCITNILIGFVVLIVIGYLIGTFVSTFLNVIIIICALAFAVMSYQKAYAQIPEKVFKDIRSSLNQ